MKNKTYKVLEIIEKFKKYHDKSIKIIGEKKEFNINFNIKGVPHLLGLQYMNKSKNNSAFGANERFKFCLKNKIDDAQIINKIEENFGKVQAENVKNRINTFGYFMDNLEHGFIVNKTLDSNMTVSHLIIQDKNNEIMHLGILSGNNGGFLEDFEDEKTKDILKSYFVEDNMDYFIKSKIIEEIKDIRIYDEILEDFLPLSFNEEKNKNLIEKFFNDKEHFNYKESLNNIKDEKIEKKKNIKIPKKKKSKESENER